MENDLHPHHIMDQYSLALIIDGILIYYMRIRRISCNHMMQMATHRLLIKIKNENEGIMG